MPDEYYFHEFENTQQETLTRTIQAHQACLSALKTVRPLKGGMHWKKIKGKEYLYKYRDRYGNGVSLGPRSPETERLFAEFGSERQDSAALLASRRDDLAAASRFCRAALIHRVPEVVIRIMRRLELSGSWGAPLRVIGTQALYAYEFAAGVFIDTPKNSPFWSDAPQQLTLATAAPIPSDQLLSLLRQADRSFNPLPDNGFQAVNKVGFQVRFLRPPTFRSPAKPGHPEVPVPVVPAESGDLIYLLSAPKFSQVVIGKKGTPATLVVPDPRALALHKLWLSQQEGRKPAKRSRDRVQAMALAELILRYLPQYYFFSSQLNLFPPEVVRPAQDLVEGYELSPDFDLG
jgi:hypothetical protein